MKSARFAWATLVLVSAACDGLPGEGDDGERAGRARIEVFVPLEGIPPDGECTHITSVRLADFETRNYVGPLDGAVFIAPKGETRITATAYPPPCGSEPTEPPWVADEQILFLVQGTNPLTLNFRPNASVVVDPIFWDDLDPQLAIQPGSQVRTGRNFEDTAGGNYAIDGWQVLQIGLPPNGGGGSPSTTFLFTTEGSPVPYTPRGMARMPDGRSVFQVSESTAPLHVFNGAGSYLESWPVQLDPGMLQFDITDGLERVDATHLVRTAWLNTPLVCTDGSGPDCIQSALEILEVRSGPSGNYVAVTQQILVPAPYNQEYPLGVTPGLSGSYIVTTLPGGPDSRLLRLNAAGTIVQGPVTLAGSNEGLFLNTPLTKLGALTYEGALSMHNPTTLVPRAGETFSYPLGVGLSNPLGVAWRPASNSFVAVSGSNQVIFANDTFTTASSSPIDTSAYLLVNGVDVDSDGDQLLITDRIPPIDPDTGLRTVTLDAYDITSGVPMSSVQLAGVPNDARGRTLAYMGGGQVASHYRRASGAVDPALDATIFVHDLDGTLAAVINLSAWGVHRILDLNYLPASDEIVLLGTDVDGVVRLMVTTRGGTPVRSYRTDAIPFVSDMAPITTGPFAGDVGVVTSQPSAFLRIAAP